MGGGGEVGCASRKMCVQFTVCYSKAPRPEHTCYLALHCDRHAPQCAGWGLVPSGGAEHAPRGPVGGRQGANTGWKGHLHGRGCGSHTGAQIINQALLGGQDLTRTHSYTFVQAHTHACSHAPFHCGGRWTGWWLAGQCVAPGARPPGRLWCSHWAPRLHWCQGWCPEPRGPSAVADSGRRTQPTCPPGDQRGCVCVGGGWVGCVCVCA
jgi:hypothetical protein